MPTIISLPTGDVMSTHIHPTYGPCIIISGMHGNTTVIRTSNGTAIVPTDSITTEK